MWIWLSEDWSPKLKINRTAGKSTLKLTYLLYLKQKRSVRPVKMSSKRFSFAKHEDDLMARWRKRTCRCCACVYCVSWETGTSWKLCKDGVGDRGGEGQHQAISNGPFYWYGGHIEFIRFKEYYGMPKGHLLSIYVCFLGKKGTSLYISREKGDHYYIQHGAHNDLFFPLDYNLFLGKLEEKLARKVHVNTDASIWDRAYAPWASHNTP